jgi:hypothetical protein
MPRERSIYNDKALCILYFALNWQALYMAAGFHTLPLTQMIYILYFKEQSD